MQGLGLRAFLGLRGCQASDGCRLRVLELSMQCTRLRVPSFYLNPKSMKSNGLQDDYYGFRAFISQFLGV